MTLDVAKAVFAPYVVDQGDGLVLNLGRGLFVPLETFVTLFAEASNVPTFDELIAIDGGVKGYQGFLDRCRAEGLIA